MTKKKLLVAEIRTAHGIRGLVKMAVHLEDAQDIENYNPLESSDGRKFTVKLKNALKGDWLAEVNGISDRNQAELLRGIELFIDRDQLPPPEEGEIYMEDLVGCDAITADGHKIGEIVSVDNFGASDLIEIKPIDGSKTYYLPIAEPYVQDIDLDQRIVVVEPAEEFMA